MDPALHELLSRAAPEAWLEAIAWLAPGASLPDPARVVAVFGDVVTCRVRARDVVALRDRPEVASLKAARPIGPGGLLDVPSGEAAREPRAIAPDGGAGVVVGVLDWEFDLAHRWLRRPDGGTRVLALWDQRARGSHPRYGYGAEVSRAAIDEALASGTSFGSRERAAHGTHVASIAARAAPGADLVLVHLATARQPETYDLGDSARLLEAIDFVRTVAADRPWVVNMSLGRTGGEHGGRSLVERAMDQLLDATPGSAIVSSAGNYYRRGLHHAGIVRCGRASRLAWTIHADDRTANELEVWYSGRDRLAATLWSPGGMHAAHAELGELAQVRVGGRSVGRLYHRAHDPTNGDHHIDLILDPGAPAGSWRLALSARDIVDGRYHAWIERDRPGSDQAEFPPSLQTPRTTLGTIANGYRTIVVGASDGRSPDRPPAMFSSSGPTRDGRAKPDLLAPGVAIRAARSARTPDATGTELVAMSGTSMAAPHVTAAVACMFSAVAPRRLTIAETRALLLGTAAPASGDPERTGAGHLDAAAALAAATAYAALPPPRTSKEPS